MASPGPDQSTSGKWTFVNSKGEEEDLDDCVSTSSSSSSEFVKLGSGQDVVSYHHRNKENQASDTGVSSLSEDEKTFTPSRVVTESLATDGCGDIGDGKPKGDSPASGDSDATMLEVSAVLSSPLPLTTETLSSEDDSDLEILPVTQPVEGVAIVCGSEEQSRGDEVLVDSDGRTGASTLSYPSQVTCTMSCDNRSQSSFLSRQTAEDSPVQFRLVLLPRSLSVTDSDSDFSHLDSHSSADHSETEDLSDHAENSGASSVEPGFCFVNQGHSGHSHDGGNVEDVARQAELEETHPDGGNDLLHVIGNVKYLNPAVSNDHVAQQNPLPDHNQDDLDNVDALLVADVDGIGNGAAHHEDNDATDNGDDDLENADAALVVGDVNGNEDDDDDAHRDAARADNDDDERDHGDDAAVDNDADRDHDDNDDADGDHGDDAAVDNDADRDHDDNDDADRDHGDDAAVDNDANRDHDDNDDDEDTGTESGVEDDRIESDQSDGLAGEEEDDLSFSNIGLENISLHEVNLTRQYVHQPNKYLSGTLSLIVIMAGWMALGLGIGHSLGSSRLTSFNSLHQTSIHQIHRLHQTQDNLFLCLRHKRDVINTLTRERQEHDEFEDQRKDLTQVLLERNGLKEVLNEKEERIGQLTREIKYWKMQVNELYRWRTDLMKEIGHLRYLEHPGNGRIELTAKPMDVDQENISGDVDRMEPSPSSESKEGNNHDNAGYEGLWKDGSDSPGVKIDLPVSHTSSPEAEGSGEWENQTEKLKKELTLAQGRAALYQQLYLSERNRKQPVNNNITDALSCLALFAPKVNFSEIVQVLNKTIIKSFKQFPNISQIKRYIDDSLENKKIFSSLPEFQVMFEELSKLWLKWSFQGESPGSGEPRYEDRKQRAESKYSKGQRQSEEQKNMWSKNLKQLLNETQESVSRVSREIQEKWKQMKNISEDLRKKHQPTIKKWQANLSQQISDIGSKIKQKIQRKSSCWFGRRKARHEKWRKHNAHKEKKETATQERKPGSRNGEKKLNHKDKPGMDKYQRKVFKKTLRKLIKTVKRLNAKTFSRLGYKGISRMVVDLQYFQSTYRGYFPDHTTEQWVNCQVNWWLAQLDERKFDPHGCTTDLFRWQSRLGKKTGKGNKKRGDKCGKSRKRSRKWEHKNGDKEDKMGMYKREKEDTRRRRGHEKYKPRPGKETDFAGSERFARTKRRGNDQKQGPKKHREHSSWKSTSNQNFTGDEKSGEWLFKSRKDRENEYEESWYIRKMNAKKLRNSEMTNRDGRWLFDRADDRDFSRKRPDDWYFRRAEGRRKGDYPKKTRDANYYHGEEYEDGRSEYYNSYGFSTCFW